MAQGKLSSEIWWSPVALSDENHLGSEARKPYGEAKRELPGKVSSAELIPLPKTSSASGGVEALS